MGALADMAAWLRKLESPGTVQFGWPADVVGEELARIAGINMAGGPANNPPARPILDRVRVELRKEIRKAQLAATLEMLRGNPGKARAIGEELAALLYAKTRAALEGPISPGNADSTIARKGADAPLRTPGAGPGGDRLYRELVARVLPPGTL